MNAFEDSLNKNLKDFTLSLIPSDEYIDLVTRLSEKVLRALKAKSKAPIDRVLYAGSIGKSTEIMVPDVDLVVLINGELPKYKDVLSDWEDILLMNESLKVDPDSIKQTGISLQFKFLDNGIEVDLLPGTNFVSGRQPGGQRLAQSQQSGAMNNMNPWNYRDFSSSLSESQIGFMKDQSEFAHQVVRLAKFWYKSLYLGPQPIYGVKSMLEMIAVAAAMKEDGQDEKSLLRTFSKFLEDVAKITELRLGFKKLGPGKWVMDDGRGSPQIIEPSNPYNDFAKNFKNRDNETKSLMDFAKITRSRIRTAVDHLQVGPDGLFTIFRPQPTALFRKLFPGSTPPKILSGTDPSYRKFNPNMVVNKKDVMKKPGVSEAVKAIQIFLVAAANAAPATLTAKREPITLTAVKALGEKMISEDIRGETYVDWNSFGRDRHEDYDVTFTVPILAKPELGGLKISFTFP